jgi:hypothetical protein
MCAHEDIAAGTAASTLDGAPTIAGGDTSLRDILPFTYHRSPNHSGIRDWVSAVESDEFVARGYLSVSV